MGCVVMYSDIEFFNVCSDLIEFLLHQLDFFIHLSLLVE